jgi:hypothetical protein
MTGPAPEAMAAGKAAVSPSLRRCGAIQRRGYVAKRNGPPGSGPYRYCLRGRGWPCLGSAQPARSDLPCRAAPCHAPPGPAPAMSHLPDLVRSSRAVSSHCPTQPNHNRACLASPKACRKRVKATVPYLPYLSSRDPARPRPRPGHAGGDRRPGTVAQDRVRCQGNS